MCHTIHSDSSPRRDTTACLSSTVTHRLSDVLWRQRRQPPLLLAVVTPLWAYLTPTTSCVYISASHCATPDLTAGSRQKEPRTLESSASSTPGLQLFHHHLCVYIPNINTWLHFHFEASFFCHRSNKGKTPLHNYVVSIWTHGHPKTLVVRVSQGGHAGKISRSSSHWKCLLYPLTREWWRGEKEGMRSKSLQNKKEAKWGWASLRRCDRLPQHSPGGGGEKKRAEYSHRFGGMWLQWEPRHKGRNFPSKSVREEQLKSVGEKAAEGMSGI